ncbi:MAG: hypothetical protein PHE43_00615 [Candidatus Nanoarchaeia archaeon]|nr:hypothetical protein [Candidatus Nanoarchaeia archaeon]
MSKRGQVTLLIIIGILIVATISIFIAFRESIFDKSKEVLGGEKTEEEVQEIQDYVDDCLSGLGYESSYLIGLQGGYINVPRDRIPESDANKFSNRILIGDLEIPYWYYQQANNVDKVQYPTLEYMNQELEKYIEDNLDSCLDNFKQFSEYKITEGKKEIKVDIGDETTGVLLSMPLTIVKDDKQFNLDTFGAEINSKLGKLYKIARQVVDAEDKDYYLEEKTIDMLVSYKELPFSDKDINCQRRVWLKQDIESSLKKIISTNIERVKISGTSYNEENDYYVWDLLRNNYPEVSINLRFSDNFPFEMDVNPNENGLLISKGVYDSGIFNGLLGQIFCLNDDNFVYDIKYPVLFMLEEDGQMFNFGYMVVIAKNQARKNEIDVDPVVIDNPICENLNKLVDVRVYDSGDFTKAQITYKCGTSSCYLGEVDGERELYFPTCYNGQLVAENEDGKALVDLSTNIQSTVIANIENYYDVPYEIKLINRNTGATREVDGEQVIFEINSDKYSTLISEKSGRIKLMPGTYDISSYVMSKEGRGITVKSQKIENCAEVPKGILGFIGVTDEECTTVEIPEMKFDQNLIGGSNFKFKFSEDKLKYGTKIIFYTMYDNSNLVFEDPSLLTAQMEEEETSIFFEYPEII